MRSLAPAALALLLLAACSSVEPQPTTLSTPGPTPTPLKDAAVADVFASELYVATYTGTSGSLIDRGLVFPMCTTQGLSAENTVRPPLMRVAPNNENGAVTVEGAIEVAFERPTNVELFPLSVRAYPWETLDWDAQSLVGSDTYVAELTPPMALDGGHVRIAPRLPDGTRLPNGVYAIVLTLQARAGNLYCAGGESVGIIRVVDPAP